MGATSFGHCYCCTRTFGFSLDAHPERPPTACIPCRNRGGLCLHNIGSRREYSPIVAHYSVTHSDDSGATDPATCTWCVNREAALA